METGNELWRGDLPTSAKATPMTYQGPDGKQYLVVCAGGFGVPGAPPLGDYVVAFSFVSRLSVGIHPVREALRARRPLDKVLIAKGASGPRIQEIVDLCRAQSVPVRFEPRELLDRASKGTSHQSVIAFGSVHDYVELSDVVEAANLLVILDGVEDPHNLGAIIRTAHAAGASAVVVPERRSAPLTESVGRAAAGALEYLPIARITNVSRTLEELKKRGFWIYGLDEGGPEVYDRIEYNTTDCNRARR